MGTKTGVLIVDDDSNLREILSGILRASGYVPIAVATGKAALDRIEEEEPAVALIDLRLEAMSGLELMRDIKERSPDTECIVLTGHATQKSAIEAVNLGAYGYVQKPYDMEQLLMTVRRAIEKQEAEEALRAQRDKLEGIIASLVDGLDIVSQDYRVHFQNKMLRDRFGDLIGGICYEGYMGRETPCKSCPMRKAIATDSTQRVELIGTDGREYEVTATPFQDIDGEMKAIEVVRDITERKRAEEALQESEEKYRTILENIEDGYYEVDIAGNFTFFNDSLCGILGYPKDELLGMNNRQYMDDESAKQVYQTFNEVYRTGKPAKAFDWEVTRKDGTKRFVEASVSLIGGFTGGPIGFRGIVRDITERKRTEQRVRRLLDQQIAANQLALALGETRDLGTIYHTIYEHVHKLMDAEAFIVSFYDEEEKLIRAGYVVSEGTVHDAAIFPPIPLEEVGHGTQSQVIHTGQPFYAADLRKVMERTRTEHTIFENGTVVEGPPPERNDISRSALYVPMKIEGETIGVMQAQSYQLDAYSQEDMDLLAALANVAAIAVQNARLYEETRRRALEQETVSRIAYALNTLDVRDAFPVLVEGLQELTGCDVVSLAVMDETGEQFIITDLKPPFPPPFPLNLRSQGGGEGSVMPLSATAALESLQVGRPHLIADLSTETHSPLEQSLYQADLHSRVILPLLSGGEVFGTLNLGDSRTGLFREDQLPVLQQIADAVALAVENSLLFQAEREQRELAEALEEAAAAISSTLEPDQVLDRILEQAERVVAGDAFNIMLVEEGVAQVVRSRGYERLGLEKQIARFAAPVIELPSLVQMVQTREPVVIPDTSTDLDWVSLEGWEWEHSYVGAPIRVGGLTVGVLNVDGTQPGHFGPADAHRLKAFADHAAAAIENARLFEQAQQEIAERKRAEGELQQLLEQLRRTFEGTVEVLVSAIEMRDPYTAGHQRRVTQLACAIANEMGLPEEQIQGIHMAGLIHDVGKINVPAEILSKPGTLSDLENGLIRMHAQVGYDVLKKFDFPWPVAQIVLQHHERMDGSGYPQGLSGEEMLLEARILAVADVVTAMASHRPYRSALGMDKALEEISQNRGVLYDPEVVDICLMLFTEKGFEFE